ncbi:MAG TPA: Imm50 family immunity protein [Myxococcaceae bacterium]|nr:Imm50 family immunity protein [Myxococcaceae bacterium]
MSWLYCADNPEAVTQLYGAAVPSLEGVRLAEVSLHEDGPRLRLRGDFGTFPENPPARWRLQGYNTVHFELDFFHFSDVSIQGWDSDNRVTLHLESLSGPQVALRVTGDTVNIQLRCAMLRISRLEGYQRQLDPEEG